MIKLLISSSTISRECFTCCCCCMTLRCFVLRFACYAPWDLRSLNLFIIIWSVCILHIEKRYFYVPVLFVV